MINFYLINHTEIYNPQELICGQAELPLIENFTADFDWIKEQLSGKIYDAECYSASSRRCQKLASSLHTDFVALEEINDLSFGAWELKSWDEIAAASKTKWRKDRMNFKPKGAESLTEIIDRASVWLEKIKTGEMASDILVISGPYFIKALLLSAMQWAPESILQMHLAYGSISKIMYKPDTDLFYLDIWNKTRMI